MSDTLRQSESQPDFEASHMNVDNIESPSSASIPGTSNTYTSSLLGQFNLYRPPDLNSSSNAIPLNLPPQYFEPTVNDLRATQASLAARASALRDAPLMTSKLREEKNKERLNRWPNATIRIKFADRSQLEKTFPSTDKIKSVYAFVRTCLRDDLKPHKFVLYQTPPHRELKVSDADVRDKTLFDLQLAPASVLMFKFLEDSVEMEARKYGPPLLPEVIKQYVDLPIPLRPDDNTYLGSTMSPSPETTNGKTEKKLPKWFKSIHKK